MTINDKKWKILFDTLNILDEVESNGFYDITAAQIKTVREPRLMCKMDFKQSVAKPFKDNELSILAIQNGIYRIAKTSPFFEINTNIIQDISTVDFTLPDFIKTLDFENITSESQALDAASASGMLTELLGEENYLTVRGRRYSSIMSVKIKETNSNRIQEYPISSVQIEVDGGYEGESILALIEAKMGAADNMNMRQLVYPHVHFENTVEKNVKTYVMFYEVGSIFTFIPMLYENNYPILHYDDARRFRLINNQTTQNLNAQKIISMPQPGHGAPFPQADDFEKVLFGYLKIAKSEQTEEELFSELPIVPRQYNYYFNAMKWLGLVDKSGPGKPIFLTEFGENLLNLSEKKRLLALYQGVCQNNVVQHILSTPDAPLPEHIKYENGLVGASMYPRRRSTILAWLRYFKDNL